MCPNGLKRPIPRDLAPPEKINTINDCLPFRVLNIGCPYFSSRSPAMVLCRCAIIAFIRPHWAARILSCALPLCLAGLQSDWWLVPSHFCAVPWLAFFNCHPLTWSVLLEVLEDRSCDQVGSSNSLHGDQSTHCSLSLC